jgi:hypothetical protein
MAGWECLAPGRILGTEMQGKEAVVRASWMRRVGRRLERTLLGAVMVVAAWVIERRLQRMVERGRSA